jgi:hypothetical protein
MADFQCSGIENDWERNVVWIVINDTSLFEVGSFFCEKGFWFELVLARLRMNEVRLVRD